MRHNSPSYCGGGRDGRHHAGTYHIILSLPFFYSPIASYAFIQIIRGLYVCAYYYYVIYNYDPQPLWRRPRHLACRLGLGLVVRLGLGQVDRALRHLNSATAAKTEYVHLAYLYLEYGIGSLRMRFHPS